MPSSAAIVARPLRVLVTGASGLLGRELCGVLAGRGHGVTALLHRNRVLSRNDGRAIPVRGGDGPPVPGAVSVLDGDVTAERFGLAPARSAAVAAGLDLIVHCAAVTAFNLPDASYDRVNVGGTARSLAFAAQASPPVPLLHVSTAYVCGRAEGPVPEAPAAPGGFNNGYERSKAAAEALVLSAHGRGHRVAVARPSVVAGDWAGGVVGAFGSTYQLFRLLADGRIGALPAADAPSLNLVPIDHVTDALADIAEHMEAADGRIFHLAAADPVPLAALETLQPAFPHLHLPRFVPPDRFDTARLPPRERWLAERVAAVYACYLRPSPRFVIANLPELSGRNCPPADAGYLGRLIRFAQEAGFLPAARSVQRTSG